MKVKVLVVLAGVLAFSCQADNKWIRTESGLMYKVYPSGSEDSIARLGRTIKVNYVQKAGDTVIESTYERMPYYEMVLPGYAHPYNPSAVFAGLRKGDSVVVKQRVDSMLKKKILKKLPGYLKQKDEWITTIKVLDVFVGDSMLLADKEREAGRVKSMQLKLGKKRIERYLLLKGWSAAEIEDGIFIMPMTNGKGAKPVHGSTVRVKMKIRTLSDKIISKEDDEAFSFTIGAGYLPEAIEKAILYFREGDKMKVFVPAVMVFGVEPGNRSVRVEDDLEVEVEVMEVEVEGK